MSWKYRSTTTWLDEEGKHGKMEMDSGYSIEFHKPSEFGGVDGIINPEDAFVASLAMCFSITFQEITDKMRMEIEDFELETEGILEEGEEGKEFTKIILRPKVKTDAPESKVQRAVELTKKNCLIARSMKSEIVIETEFL